MVKRNGLRRPEATIRRALVSGPMTGLSGIGAPVAGSIRRIAPSRPVGSALLRRSWLRRAPPSAVGGVRAAPTPPGGSPHGFSGLPSWPQSVKLKLAPSPPLTYRAPSAPKASEPTEWLGYCWHQSSTRTCSGPVITLPLACKRETRPLITQPSAVAPGGVGQPSEVPPTLPHRGAVPPMAASWAYRTYTYGLAGKPGSSARPSRPRSQKLCTLVRRSAKTVGLVSLRLSKTLIRPLFSPTNTRPSAANWTTVGSVSPLNAIVSWNPGGSVSVESGTSCGWVELVNPLSATVSLKPVGSVDAAADPGPTICKPSTAASATATMPIRPRERMTTLARPMPTPSHPLPRRLRRSGSYCALPATVRKGVLDNFFTFATARSPPRQRPRQAAAAGPRG